MENTSVQWLAIYEKQKPMYYLKIRLPLAPTALEVIGGLLLLFPPSFFSFFFLSENKLPPLSFLFLRRFLWSSSDAPAAVVLKYTRMLGGCLKKSVMLIKPLM